jgi:cytochrome c-type biogenesis protein CcmH/NrfG
MTDKVQSRVKGWTPKQAVMVSFVCLTVGIAGGWSIRSAQSRASAASGKTAIVTANAATEATPAALVSTAAAPTAGPSQLKEMADTHAAPLLDQLKSNPKNPDLLASIGNVYYDAQQYPTAVEYYTRTLKLKPSDTSVRTDMATAYWYMGNADSAIAEFNKALVYEPNNPNTLFNLGIVKWKGKMDASGAADAWKRLLAANPNYEGKDKVEQMLAQLNKQPAGLQQPQTK